MTPAIVTDEDRQWALDQCPAWAQRGPLTFTERDDAFPELADEKPRTMPDVLVWDIFVARQVERFEKHYVGERKTYGDWSRLWRKSWWPKADPRKLHPHLVPPDARPYVLVHRHDPDWQATMRLVTPRQAMIAERIGVIRFDEGDPLFERVKRPKPPAITDLTKRIVGERD